MNQLLLRPTFPVLVPGNLAAAPRDCAAAFWIPVTGAPGGIVRCLDGTNRPNGLVEAAGSGVHAFNSQNMTVAANSRLRARVRVKANGRRYIFIQVADGTTTNASIAHYDLYSGAVGGPTVVLGALTATSARMRELRLGWWELTLNYTLAAVANTYAYVGTTLDFSNITYTGTSGVVGFYMDYFETYLNP